MKQQGIIVNWKKLIKEFQIESNRKKIKNDLRFILKKIKELIN